MQVFKQNMFTWCQGEKINKHGLERRVATKWEAISVYNIILWKPEGKRPHGRPWRKWEIILKWTPWGSGIFPPKWPTFLLLFYSTMKGTFFTSPIQTVSPRHYYCQNYYYYHHYHYHNYCYYLYYFYIPLTTFYVSIVLCWPRNILIVSFIPIFLRIRFLFLSLI